MFDTIGETGVHRHAAQMEVGLARMPHRPAADADVKVEQARLVGDLRARLCRHAAAARGWRDRRMLIDGTPAGASARGDRYDARRGTEETRVGERGKARVKDGDGQEITTK